MPYAHLNAQRLWYADSGGRGPCVIALHGFPLDASQYIEVEQGVGAKLRFIRMDGRASGASEWDGAPFTAADQVADVLALADHLELKRFVLLGSGHGGDIAVRTALAAPERVAGMVLVGTQVWSDDPLAAAGYRALADQWADAGLVEQLAGAWIGSGYPNVAAHWQARWATYPPAHIRAVVDAIVGSADVLGRLGQVKCPSLVMHGDADEAIPYDRSRELADTLPGTGHVVTIAGAAHLAVSTHPDAVIGALVGFMERIGQ